MSALLPTYVPRRRTGLLELDLGDGMIIYDRAESLVHRLNPPGALLWQLCDGRASVQELARDVAKELGLDPRLARTQVEELISSLEELDLVDDASIRETSPSNQPKPLDRAEAQAETVGEQRSGAAPPADRVRGTHGLPVSLPRERQA